jgi:hypothetical protein
MPGYAELMDMTGFKSKNAIYKLINKLVELNFLNKDSAGKISLVTGAGEIPFPNGSVVITRLDPMDPTSPPVAVSKEFAEKEIFND